jgi:hypothetical protein
MHRFVAVVNGCSGLVDGKSPVSDPRGETRTAVELLGDGYAALFEGDRVGVDGAADASI